MMNRSTQIYLQKNTSRMRTGFTIIEMLIAVFIFTVSLTALMSMSAQGLKSTRNTQDRIVAEFLAIEGIEVVRNVRDQAFIAGYSGGTWSGVFQGNTIFGSNGCFNSATTACKFEFSSNKFSLSDCTTDADCDIYIDEPSYHYDYDSSSPAVKSKYNRKIFIDSIADSDDNEIEVRSVVTWGNEEVVYTDNLFLWL